MWQGQTSGAPFMLPQVEIPQLQTHTPWVTFWGGSSFGGSPVFTENWWFTGFH
jgi:hypothetical protein